MYVFRIHMAVNNIQFTRIEIRIAKYLFKHYNDRYNARQLARILNINHAHANKLCNILADKHLLAKEKIGNSVFFSYEYGNKLAIKFMEYMLSLEEKEFPKWLSVLSHSVKKIKDFNDIDVLLMYNAEKSKDVKKIKDEIRKSELIEKPIRYVDIAERDILLNKEDKIFYNILSESLVFHNPEKYVEVVRKCRK